MSSGLGAPVNSQFSIPKLAGTTVYSTYLPATRIGAPRLADGMTWVPSPLTEKPGPETVKPPPTQLSEEAASASPGSARSAIPPAIAAARRAPCPCRPHLSTKPILQRCRAIYCMRHLPFCLTLLKTQVT
jgi:hypothetical protein